MRMIKLSKSAMQWMSLYYHAKAIFTSRAQGRFGKNALRDFKEWWTWACPFSCIVALRDNGELK